jgi:Tol biopolymer transport system component
VIVFNNGPGPLYRVSSAGGQPVVLTKMTQGTASHQFPSFMPDGRHVLFFGIGSSEGGIYVASLEDGSFRRLAAASSGGVFSPLGGHLLFVRDGTLLAQAFDSRTLTLSGESFPIAERVESSVFQGVMAFSVSDTGALAYGTGAGAQSALRLTWVDRQGKVIETVGPDANYRGVDLSPDGRRVAAHRHDGSGGDIWLTDFTRGATSRFTFDATQDNSSPIWSPDGTQIVYGSNRGGKWGLFRKPADGAGDETKLIDADLAILPMSWAPDGQSILYWTSAPRTGSDQWRLPLTGDRKPIPLLNSPFLEGHPQVSPDGKWVSYQSNETGQAEVYVRPYPSAPGKSQISTNGGIFSRWRGDGRELYYMTSSSNGKLMAVEVNTAGIAFESGTPKALFDTGYINLPSGGGNYHTFAVARDGQRFLIPRPVSTVPEDASSPIVVVLNWAAGRARG